MKENHRIGRGPAKRREHSEKLIRTALKDGKRTFKELLKATGLSRPALADRLKEMLKHRELLKEADSEDCRIRYYSLTTLGLQKLQQQEELSFLNNAKLSVKTEAFTVVDAETASRISEALVKTMEHMMCKGIIYAIEHVKTNPPKDCIVLSIFTNRRFRGSLKCQMRLAEIAKCAMLAEMGRLSRRELEKLSETAIVFRFSKDKINKWLKTLYAVA